MPKGGEGVQVACKVAYILMVIKKRKGDFTAIYQACKIKFRVPRFINQMPFGI